MRRKTYVVGVGVEVACVRPDRIERPSAIDSIRTADLARGPSYETAA